MDHALHAVLTSHDPSSSSDNLLATIVRRPPLSLKTKLPHREWCRTFLLQQTKQWIIETHPIAMQGGKHVKQTDFIVLGAGMYIPMHVFRRARKN